MGFCLGPNIEVLKSNDEVAIYPTCEEFLAYFWKTVNETNEFFDLVPNREALRDMVKNETSSPLSVLKSQDERIRRILGLLPNQR